MRYLNAAERRLLAHAGQHRLVEQSTANVLVILDLI